VFRDLELVTERNRSGTPISDESSSTVLNYRLHPVDGQTIFTPGPDTGVELDGVTNYVTAGGWTSAASESKAWYFSGIRSATWGPLAGGTRIDGNDPRAPTQRSDVLISADLSVPGKATWTNTTLPTTVEPRINPNIVWIPVSMQGILLAIGGVYNDQNFGDFGLNSTQTEDSRERSPSYMTTIPVYDVANDEWSTQNTTGDAPSMRAEFCSVVASASASSFDIYIYGGDNGLSGRNAEYALDDVWVLSVPEFHWTKVSDGNFAHGRSGHACALPFPNQMLVFGGQNLNSSNLCIQDGSVLDVFDLNTLQWTRKYAFDAYEDYSRPQAVRDSIAAAEQPSQVVQSLFDASYPGRIMTFYPYKNPDNGTNPSSEGSSQSSGSSNNNAGAIAGGVVGGVAVLVIGFLIFWFCRPSRRAARKSRRSTAMSETTLGASAVSRWIRRTHFGVPPDGHKGDSEDGSNDGHAVPVRRQHGPAELYGDVRNRHEIASTEDDLSPRSSTVVDPTSDRTRHASVEAGGKQIHEMLDESTVSPRTSAGPDAIAHRAGQGRFRSIDETSSGDLIAAASSAGRAAPLSTVGANDSRHSLTSRPPVDRMESDMSSELPTTPPSRGQSQLRMSANSAGPISPLLQDGGVIGGAAIDPVARPGNRRHNSSMISGISEIAGLGDAERIEGDRTEAQRILEGDERAVDSPEDARPLNSIKRADSSRSRFKEDVSSSGG
jgi:hypothetical protein